MVFAGQPPSDDIAHGTWHQAWTRSTLVARLAYSPFLSAHDHVTSGLTRWTLGRIRRVERCTGNNLGWAALAADLPPASCTAKTPPNSSQITTASVLVKSVDNSPTLYLSPFLTCNRISPPSCISEAHRRHHSHTPDMVLAPSRSRPEIEQQARTVHRLLPGQVQKSPCRHYGRYCGETDTPGLLKKCTMAFAIYNMVTCPLPLSVIPGTLLHTSLSCSP